MLIALPYPATEKLFRFKYAGTLLRMLAKDRRVTAPLLAKEASVSVKAAWSLLKALEKTEHIIKNGKYFWASEKIGSECIIVNVRDEMSASLFRCRGMPRLLYHLTRNSGLTLHAIAEAARIPYRTAKRAVSQLRRAGIISGATVKQEFLRKPSQQLDLIPRKLHRRALAHFLNAVAEDRPSFTEPIVVFGDASWGKNTPTVDVLVMSRIAAPPERHVLFLRQLSSAASSVTRQFGVILNLFYSTEDVWLAQKLGLVANPHPAISEAFDGICINGETPKDSDYFDLMSQVLHYSEESIQELLEKGYIVKEGEKYVCTEKAFETWRKRKAKLFEEKRNMNGKLIHFIGISSPEPTP